MKRALRTLAPVFCLAVLFAGCRSSQVVCVSGGIGDDVCAVMIKLAITVTDDAGTTIPGAEIWMRGPDQPPHSYTRAWRFGVTDQEGRLESLHCYMGSLEYRFWLPDEEPVTVRLLTFREGYGSAYLTLTPPTADVLETGGLMIAPPGPEGQGSPEGAKPGASSRAFELPVTIVLKPTASAVP